MLGYTKTDLDEMSASIEVAIKQLSPYLLSSPKTEAGLNKANDFLQGLWAEGYFD